MTTAIEPHVEYDVPVETLGQEAIAQGKALRRTQTQFTTAIAVIKPRDRKKIIRDCEEEAAIAGDEFYYSWTVKGKRGSQLVEGLSVQGALSAARNWGNCAVPVEVMEEKDIYIFTASFLDMETGANFQRVFRQRKQQNIGMQDTARSEDIIFQIGQSKAIRNVILNALPSWLTSKILAKAKENIIDKINKMGIAVAREKTTSFFSRYGVALTNIEHKVGKKITAWTVEDLALLQGAINALLTGQESAESLFPAPNEEVAGKTEGKAAALKQKLQEAQAPKQKTQTSVPPLLGTGQTPRIIHMITDQIFPLLESLGVKEKGRAEELLASRVLGVVAFESLNFEQAKSFLDFLGEWKMGGCNVHYTEERGWVVEYPPTN